MKKSVVHVILWVIIVILLFSYFYFDKTTTLERVFNISLTQDAHIAEYHRSFTIIDRYDVAAKIEISKEDYTKFVSSVSGKYLSFDPAEYKDENLDEFAPPESNDYLNIEKYNRDLSWWDLEINQITVLFYRESENWRIGVRQPCRRRIYVSETSDAFTLYLYYSS